MRFVFLSLGYAPDLAGGGFRYATEVAELLAARGREVHVLYPAARADDPARERRREVELWRASRPGGGFFKNWRTANAGVRAALGELLKDPRPTFVLSHHAYLEPAARGVPYTVMLHGPWAEEHRVTVGGRPRPFPTRWRDALICRVMARVERRHLSRAMHVFVASQYSRRALQGWHPGLAVTAEAIGGGADPVRFRPPDDRAALRRGYGLGERDFLFLAVRRLDPRMGLMHLAEAFAMVGRERPEARLWIAGKGPQREALEARLAAAGLGERAKLLGFVPEEELPALYGAADAVLMPSLDLEGFGLATAEALACGAPVLASRSGANPEVVAPLGERLLFPPGDVPALAGLMSGVVARTLALPARETCLDYARRSLRWDGPADAFERAASRFAIHGGSTVRP